MVNKTLFVKLEKDELHAVIETSEKKLAGKVYSEIIYSLDSRQELKNCKTQPLK